MKTNVKKKGSSRGIILASIFVICVAAVIWRWLQPNTTDHPGQTAARDSLFQQERLIYYNSTVYGKALQAAQTGDIAVRLGNDMTSEMLRRLSLTDPQYSHAGIISKENDTVFVYHALGGELNPDQKLQREPLWSFAHPQNNKALGIYRLAMDSTPRQQLMTTVKTYYQQGVLFDTAFDLHTKDRLYCTEFVAASIEKALNDTAYFHRSVVNGKTYFAVDDLTKAKNTTKIAGWKY